MPKRRPIRRIQAIADLPEDAPTPAPRATAAPGKSPPQPPHPAPRNPLRQGHERWQRTVRYVWDKKR